MSVLNYIKKEDCLWKTLRIKVSNLSLLSPFCVFIVFIVFM